MRRPSMLYIFGACAPIPKALSSKLCDNARQMLTNFESDRFNTVLEATKPSWVFRATMSPHVNAPHVQLALHFYTVCQHNSLQIIFKCCPPEPHRWCLACSARLVISEKATAACTRPYSCFSRVSWRLSSLIDCIDFKYNLDEIHLGHFEPEFEA